MPSDALLSINEKCGTTNNMTALSIFSAVVSSGLAVTSIPLNLLIIICILRGRRRQFKSVFYKLLLNIAIADLLTGLISDPSSINFHIKEALEINISIVDAYVLHLSVFFTDAVALNTMTLLSFDRLIALSFPLKYFKGIKRRNETVLVLATWPVAVAVVAPYFKVHFIKQLAIFSAVNVSVAIVSLFVNTVVYKTKGRNKILTSIPAINKMQVTTVNIDFKNSNVSNDVKPKEPGSDQENDTMVSGINTSPEQIHDTRVAKGLSDLSIISYTSTPNNKSAIKQKVGTVKSTGMSLQQKSTRSFLYMLLVFVLTYLPTCIMMIYMNFCVSCNCTAIHIMRDLSILSILSSSVFRALNFIISLKYLRESIFRMLNCETSETSTSRDISDH